MAQASRVGKQLLAQSATTSTDLWRHVILTLLDDYTRVQAHQGVPAAADLFEQEPDRTGDARVDAALAALAEWLAVRDGWTTPAWTRGPGRRIDPPWLVCEVAGLRSLAEAETPAVFRAHGLLITAGALERA